MTSPSSMCMFYISLSSGKGDSDYYEQQNLGCEVIELIVYQIALVDDETFDEYLLGHELLLTYEKWRAIVSDAIKKAVESLIEENIYIDHYELVERLVNILVSEHGFQELEVSQRIFISPGCLIEGEWDLKDLRDYLDNDTIRRIVEHNKQLDEEEWEGMEEYLESFKLLDEI